MVVVLVLGEFERYGALANATSAFDKKCSFPIGNGLPLEHPVVDFTLEHRGPSPLNIPKNPENTKSFWHIFPENTKCFIPFLPEITKRFAFP